MTDRQTLLALADRVERAEGPDRRLDAEISVALGRNETHLFHDENGKTQLAPWRPAGRPNGLPSVVLCRAYTGSLDAAKGAVPEGWQRYASSCGDSNCAEPEPRTVAYWGDARGPDAAAR